MTTEQPTNHHSSFWKRLSFTSRIMIIGTIIAASLIVILSGATYVAYRADKIPYLFDLQLRKAKALEARLSAHFLKRGQATTVNIDSVQESPLDMLLPRFPMGDEVFVASIAGNPTLMGRLNEKELWLRPVGDLADFWESSDDFSYIITTSGLFVGTNREDLITARSGLKRQGIDEFLRSGVAAGTKLYRNKQDGERIVAHRSVPATNVIVFCEVDAGAAMTPMFRYLAYTIYATLITLWLVFMVVAYFTRILLQPLHLIKAQLASILGGQPPAQWSHEFNDEFNAISQNVSALHTELMKRYLHLARERAARESCLTLHETTTCEQSKDEILIGLARALQHGLGLPPGSGLSLYLFPPASTADSAGKLWRIPLILSGMAVAQPECRWVNTSSWNAAILADLRNRHAPLVLNDLEFLVPFPFGANEGLIGFLSFSGVTTRHLTADHVAWIKLMVQSCAKNLQLQGHNHAHHQGHKRGA